MSHHYQSREHTTVTTLDHEEGTLVDVLKVACEELFPKFVKAGSSQCALYVTCLLLNKMFQKNNPK